MATIRELQNQETILTSWFGSGNARPVRLLLLPRIGERFFDTTQLSVHGDPRRAGPLRGPSYRRVFSMTSTDVVHHTSYELATASVTQRNIQCMAITAERGPFGAPAIDVTFR